MNKKEHKCALVLLAGGSGKRMQGLVKDKILAEIQGKPVIQYSLDTFINSGCIDGIIIVYKDEAQKQSLANLCNCIKIPLFWAQGGAERQNSVLNGLQAIPVEYEYVMIHDAGRPLVTQKNIRDLYEAMIQDNAAVLAHRVTNTVKFVTELQQKEPRLCKAEDVDRSHLWATETPQSFQRQIILDAYKHVAKENIKITDDVSAASLIGHAITFVENLTPNPKLTNPTYWKYVEFLLSNEH